LVDKFIGMGLLSRLENVLLAGLGLTIGDIVPNGGIKQERVLANDPHGPPQAAQVKLLQVDAVNQNAPAGGVIKAG
jgi:hypothetical protein